MVDSLVADVQITDYHHVSERGNKGTMLQRICFHYQIFRTVKFRTKKSVFCTISDKYLGQKILNFPLFFL